MRDLTCIEVADWAPGFALDILEPEARARVAAHLLRCQPCRQTVTGMQDSAAELLDVGPVWSEEDWNQPMETPAVRPARRRLRMVISMAAAAFLIVGTTLGPEIEQAANPPQKPVATVYLTTGGRTVGAVRFYAGHQPAIDVQIEGLQFTGTLDIVLVETSGTAVTIGRLNVARGRAAWLGPDPVPATQVSSVVLVDRHRQQVAATEAA